MEVQWALTLFSLIAGSGGALFAVTCLVDVMSASKIRVDKIADIVAIVAVLFGGCCSVMHLAQTANIMAAAANIFSFSGISIELMLIGIVVVLLVIHLVMIVRGSSAGALKVVAVFGIVFGLALGFFTGHGYVFPSQPNWNSELLPLGYLLGDVAVGSLAYQGLSAKLELTDRTGKTIAVISLVAVVASAVAYIAYATYAGFDQVDALCFWGGCILVGGVVAGVCAWPLLKKKSAAFAYAGSACALVGGLCFRIVMWMLGTGVLHLFDAAASFTIF